MRTSLQQSSDVATEKPTQPREILLTLTVVDHYERSASGLTKDNFSVFEKNKPLEITSFAATETPASVAVLVDVSASQTRLASEAAKASYQFISKANQNNKYMVIAFNSKAEMLSDWSASEKDLQGALAGIVKFTPKHQTALYDSCMLALSKMAYAPQPKRVLLLLSDGMDNQSTTTFRKLLTALKRSDVMVYAIGLSSVPDLIAGEGQAVLEELASVSGGKAFFPRSRAELIDICETMALQLKGQYQIRVKTLGPPDEQFHDLKVKMTTPKGLPTLSVRYRKSYFSH